MKKADAGTDIQNEAGQSSLPEPVAKGSATDIAKDTTPATAGRYESSSPDSCPATQESDLDAAGRKKEPGTNEGAKLPLDSRARNYSDSTATNIAASPSSISEPLNSQRRPLVEGILAPGGCGASPPSASKPGRKRGVPHVYRDYSNVPDTAGYVRKKTGGVTQPFPEKLHELLERENEPSVISWLPHGRAFLVRKPKEFTNYVMPKYFRQTKLTSFQRQLNLYGFRRITQGPDGGAYYHELFLRGRPQLCMRMQRQKVKGTGHKQPADAQTEPNFYSMPSSQAQPPETMPPQTEHAVSQAIHEELSPGLEGVHGAAELLKNIAAGLPGSSVPFSLGISAVSAEAETAPEEHSVTHPSESKPCASPAAPAPVRTTPAVSHRQLPTLLPSPSGGTQSMSLLGRIAQTGTATTSAVAQPATSPVQQSAFFWPPTRQPVVPSLPIFQETARSSIFDVSTEHESQDAPRDSEDAKAKPEEQHTISIEPRIEEEEEINETRPLTDTVRDVDEKKKQGSVDTKFSQTGNILRSKSHKSAGHPSAHHTPSTPSTNTSENPEAIINGIQTEEV